MMWLVKALAVLLSVAACAIVLARIVFALPGVEGRVDDVAEYKAILKASDIIAPLFRGALYELRRQAAPNIPDDLGIFGSSGASLHAKTFAVIGMRIFIGSLNFDPRSIQLNTEMGLLIDSEALANRLHATCGNAVTSGR